MAPDERDGGSDRGRDTDPREGIESVGDAAGVEGRTPDQPERVRGLSGPSDWGDPDARHHGAGHVRPGRSDRRRDADRTPNTLLNALVGAVVTAVTTFLLPLAPVLGGAVAGYLEGGEARDGAKVGALSGFVALVPLLLVVPFVLFFFLIDPVVGFGTLLVAALAVAFLAVYTVGFSVVGGILGVYLRAEF